MSKYYKAEDVIRAIDDAFDSIPMEQTIEILQARRNIRNLPTIEVSEDAISRAKRLLAKAEARIEELTRVKVETVVVDNEEPEIPIVVDLEKY